MRMLTHQEAAKDEAFVPRAEFREASQVGEIGNVRPPNKGNFSYESDTAYVTSRNCGDDGVQKHVRMQSSLVVHRALKK